MTVARDWPDDHGKPHVVRGEFGWLIMTRHRNDDEDIHVWGWRKSWRDAVTYATELAWVWADMDVFG